MPDRRAPVAAAILLAAATLLAFAPILGNDFVNFDDPLYVTKNVLVQRGLTLANVRWAFTSTTAVYWHPLTWISHMLDAQLWGLAAGGHHLTSLLLHTANAILLLVFLTSATGALGASAIVAACFALHPLHVESMAWVAERKDVLSTLFLLLGLCAYAAYAHRGGVLRYAAVLAAFACGLMGKPMLVTFPFLLLLLDYWPLARRDRRPLALVLEKVPLLVLALADTAFSVVQGRTVGAVRTLSAFPLPARLANAALAYAGYLRKALWPADLAVFYPYPTTFDPGPVGAAVVVLACVSIVALVLARRAPYLIVGWLWYLGTLAPTIGLLQVGHQSMADRYTYVPLIGIFVAAVFGGRALAERLRLSPRAVAAPVLAGLVACVLVTRAQAAQWRTSLTLFTHALAVTTDNYMAHEKLGEALASDGRRDEAITHFRETIRLTPTFVEAHVALADALLEAHDEPGALAHYSEAVRLKPDDATFQAKLGNALWHGGNAADARGHFEEAVRLAPDNAESLSNLGVARAARRGASPPRRGRPARSLQRGGARQSRIRARRDRALRRGPPRAGGSDPPRARPRGRALQPRQRPRHDRQPGRRGRAIRAGPRDQPGVRRGAQQSRRGARATRADQRGPYALQGSAASQPRLRLSGEEPRADRRRRLKRARASAGWGTPRLRDTRRAAAGTRPAPARRSR